MNVAGVPRGACPAVWMGLGSRRAVSAVVERHLGGEADEGLHGVADWSWWAFIGRFSGSRHVLLFQDLLGSLLFGPLSPAPQREVILQALPVLPVSGPRVAVASV